MSKRLRDDRQVESEARQDLARGAAEEEDGDVDEQSGEFFPGSDPTQHR